MASHFKVYVLELENGSYYVGHTNDLQRRLREHREGIACSHTKKFPMRRLIWSESQTDRVAAAKREREIKGWSRRKKESLWNREVGSS